MIDEFRMSKSLEIYGALNTLDTVTVNNRLAREHFVWSNFEVGQMYKTVRQPGVYYLCKAIFWHGAKLCYVLQHDNNPFNNEVKRKDLILEHNRDFIYQIVAPDAVRIEDIN